jgi:branched-chain amino acid transport system substrate-binding protein
MYQHQRRCYLSLLIFLVCAGLFMRCYAADTEVIQIGFSGPLTGISASYGQSMRQAAQLAIDEANRQSNTVAGRKVHFELNAQNDRQDNNLAVIVANYFVKSEVVGVIGNTNTTNSLATAPIFDAAHLAHISPATTGVAFTARGDKTAFRLIGQDKQAIDKLTPFLVRDLKAKKIAIVSNQTAFGNGICDLLEAALGQEKGVMYLRQNTSSSNTFDFNQLLDQIQDSNADLLFFGGNADQAAMLARSVKRKNLPIKLVSAMAGAASDNFIALAGEESDGVISLESGVPPNKMPGWKKFSNSYRKAYGNNINPFTATTYDATNVLIKAIREANTLDRKKIAEKLHTITYAGVTGAISFDQAGDLPHPPFTIYRVEDHQWRPLKILRGD